MKNIYINEHYDESFLIQEGRNIHSITIPKGAQSYNFNSILLSYCPNVEAFIVEDNDGFEYSEGVLYSKSRDCRNIEYITKAVKSLRIDEDVTEVKNWHGVDDVIVDSENIAFTVVDNMLLSQSGRELYFVFENAEEVIIPEGVTTIHYHAFEYCHNLRKIELPNTYSWVGWHTPPYEPLWVFNDNVEKPEIVIKGDLVSVVNGIVLEYNTPLYYFGDQECCRIPNNVRSTFDFNKVFGAVENFSVGDDHPSFSAVNGMLLNKEGNELLFYPRPRKEFSVPESVSVICSFAAARCNNLEEVVIPENIKKIERNAFADCKKMDSIIINGNTTEVDLKAFSGCVLTKGDYLVGLVEGVFYNGKTVTGIDCGFEGELKVREGTQSIEKLFGPGYPGVAEFGATREIAETLVIPASVNEIGRLFVPLKSIIVDDSNSEFRSVDGILFSKDMRTLIRYPERHNGCNYVVPDSVETIADYAFGNCRNLKKITIHKNIKCIGEKAFCYTKLKTLELPAQPITIGELAVLVNVYYKYGGKDKFADTIIQFRYGELLIPLKLTDNWGVNKNELFLSDFVATADVGRKRSIFFDVKKKEYKTFMAFYLCIVHGDDECRKYLKRSKKKLDEDGLYSDLITYVLNNEKKESKEEIKPLKEKTFSAAGFSDKEELEIAKSVESNGGKYLYNFTKNLDYLIYNPNCDNEPIKEKKAKLLAKKGIDISFITIEQYQKMIKNDV